VGIVGEKKEKNESRDKQIIGAGMEGARN